MERCLRLQPNGRLIISFQCISDLKRRELFSLSACPLLHLGGVTKLPVSPIILISCRIHPEVKKKNEQSRCTFPRLSHALAQMFQNSFPEHMATLMRVLRKEETLTGVWKPQKNRGIIEHTAVQLNQLTMAIKTSNQKFKAIANLICLHNYSQHKPPSFISIPKAVPSNRVNKKSSRVLIGTWSSCDLESVTRVTRPWALLMLYWTLPEPLCSQFNFTFTAMPATVRAPTVLMNLADIDAIMPEEQLQI